MSVMMPVPDAAVLARRDEIVAALHRALDPAFRRSVAAGHPPLADGQVGERIAHIIAAWQPPDLLRKAPIPP